MPEVVTAPLAVVVGGASGIGAATVARFRTDGAHVVVADRDRGEGIIGCDVTDEAQVVGLFDQLPRPPAAVVNCAGVSGTYGPVAALSLERWQHTVAVNLTGTFLVDREALRRMAPAGRGAIVNVASGAGLRGFAQLPDYVASKHGVIGLTRSAALEHARTGVRINAVAPGSVRTPMLERFAGGDEQALAGMGRLAPVGRLGTPEEIAAAIVWLCSDEARFVTGAVLSVDGGVSAA